MATTNPNQILVFKIVFGVSAFVTVLIRLRICQSYSWLGFFSALSRQSSNHKPQLLLYLTCLMYLYLSVLVFCFFLNPCLCYSITIPLGILLLTIFHFCTLNPKKYHFFPTPLYWTLWNTYLYLAEVKEKETGNPIFRFSINLILYFTVWCVVCYILFCSSVVVTQTVFWGVFFWQQLAPHVRVWDSVSLNTLHVIGTGFFDRALVCLSFSKSVRDIFCIL